MNNIECKSSAFTLAEVLITLGIIGVVAAMTIPTLVNNAQKQQYVTGLKKFYSTFSQSLRQYSVDKGCPGDLKCTEIFTAATRNDSTNNFGEELVKYIKTVKNCKMAGNAKCLPAATFALNTSGAATTLDSDLGSYKFITTDGMSLAIESASETNCNFQNDWNGSTIWGPGALQSVCAIVYVDVNGLKKPNKAGRDTFRFLITGTADLIPYGVHSIGSAMYHWNGTSNTNKCMNPAGNTDFGFGCAGRIIEEGWEMNY